MSSRIMLVAVLLAAVAGGTLAASTARTDQTAVDLFPSRAPNGVPLPATGGSAHAALKHADAVADEAVVATRTLQARPDAFRRADEVQPRVRRQAMPPANTTTTAETKEDGMAMGQLVGIIFGGLVVLLCISALAYYTCCGGYDEEAQRAQTKRNSAAMIAQNTDANGFAENNGVFSFELPDVE